MGAIVGVRTEIDTRTPSASKTNNKCVKVGKCGQKVVIVLKGGKCGQKVVKVAKSGKSGKCGQKVVKVAKSGKSK